MTVPKERLNRRQALQLLGSAAAGVACLGQARPPKGPPRPSDLESLSERICKVPAEKTFDLASQLIRSGVDPRTMLAAVFLCGVRDIRPRPHGILHTVMMVESSYQLAESAAPDETWLPVLWNLDDLKSAQADDRVEAGDWSLPPRPATRATSAAAAEREFLAAMQAWDPTRADKALIALLPHHDHDSFFEIFWPLACRCDAFIGHKMIHTAQVERALRRIGWSHAEPALRSLVMTVLVDRRTESFEGASELLPSLPAAWLQGREEPAQSESLLKEIRRRDARGAQELIVQAFKDRLGPRTVWDGLRLTGSEIFLRRPGRSAAAGRSALLPVHALTVTSAMRHAWDATKNERTKRLLVLQAAAWLATVRDAVVDIVDLSMDGPGIETLGVSIGNDTKDIGPLLELASPEHVRPFLDREPAKSDVYLDRLRSALFRRGREHHQIKYAAAMQEESRLAHPRWASRLLAPAVDYLANPKDPETEVYARSVRALRTAGL